jgi:trimeric autotransporter adhesin
MVTITTAVTETALPTSSITSTTITAATTGDSIQSCDDNNNNKTKSLLLQSNGIDPTCTAPKGKDSGNIQTKLHGAKRSAIQSKYRLFSQSSCSSNSMSSSLQRLSSAPIVRPKPTNTTINLLRMLQPPKSKKQPSQHSQQRPSTHHHHDKAASSALLPPSLPLQSPVTFKNMSETAKNKENSTLQLSITSKTSNVNQSMASTASSSSSSVLVDVFGTTTINTVARDCPTNHTNHSSSSSSSISSDVTNHDPLSLLMQSSSTSITTNKKKHNLSSSSSITKMKHPKKPKLCNQNNSIPLSDIPIPKLASTSALSVMTEAEEHKEIKLSNNTLPKCNGFLPSLRRPMSRPVMPTMKRSTFITTTAKDTTGDTTTHTTRLQEAQKIPASQISSEDMSSVLQSPTSRRASVSHVKDVDVDCNIPAMQQPPTTTCTTTTNTVTIKNPAS